MGVVAFYGQCRKEDELLKCDNPMVIIMKKKIPLVTLETNRLRIVPMTRAEFMDRAASDARGTEFAEAMEELRERFSHDRDSRFAWYTNRLIFRKDDCAYLGSIAFMNAPEKDSDKLGLVEIGYSIEEAYRGQGYMTEAVCTLCDWALAQPKVYGIIAGVMDDNPASARVLEKSGFVMTDHSDTLSLQVWKRIPVGKKPLPFWQRLF